MKTHGDGRGYPEYLDNASNQVYCAHNDVKGNELGHVVWGEMFMKSPTYA